MRATQPSTLRTALRSALQRVEGGFDAAFGMKANPWRHLGGTAFFLFFVVAGTGAYVYAAFDTSVDGAYQSVERITRGDWPLGALARSVHRYASDAFVVVVLLHVAREWINGHARGFRWYSWVSGVPLVWLVYASGIGGYWLVFDRLALWSLVATTEWLDALPLFGEPLARNFIANGVTNRLFSLLIFLHIGIPLALLLGMWAHIQRVSRPRTNPPREVALGLAAALVLLSFAKPATSGAPADLAFAPSRVDPDWFYQAIHPLADASSGTLLWWVAGVLTAALASLPWLPPAKRAPAARVDLANCNGCGRCFADCPYVAVTMRPRSDGRALAREAVVDADLCAACGICAGACPSSTPFRSGDVLRTGIDLPQRPIGAVRDELTRALARLRGASRVVVLGCDCAANAGALQATDTAVLSLPCAAMWPPSFVEYALRSGIDGVLIAGCRDGDCAYRLGNRWIEERIAGSREPHLRKTVPIERLAVASCGPSDAAALACELARFRARLRTLPAARIVAFKRRQEIADG